MKYLIFIIFCFPIIVQANEAIESLGERIFNDIRFSQYFYRSSKGNSNFSLKVGASELDTIVIRGQESPSPFAGKAMSCASCHMVDQAFGSSPGGMRGYNDFAAQTKIPVRKDQLTHTLRNTPTLVGIGSKYAQNRFSHYDGEFHDHSMTVLGNLTGRNMGWLKTEKAKALKNIVTIIKEDNGLGDLAQEFGGSYSRVFKATHPLIPNELRIPIRQSLIVSSASDAQIIERVTYFVTKYLNSLDFEKTKDGIYNGSSYDEFLKVNKIPREPQQGQSITEYTKDLLKKFQALKSPKFVKVKRFETHDKEFGFNETEWKGLKKFFNITDNNQSSRGMCVNCHMPPLFSDQSFHNIGTSQAEYDNIHGKGSFNSLVIPKLFERGKDQFFSSRAQKSDKNLTDLGMWNNFGRSGKEILTKYITKQFCYPGDSRCTPDYLLPFMLGRIKTPTLRNLGHSAPFLHNGSSKNIDEVLEHYINSSQLMKLRSLRNGAPQLRMMDIHHLDKPQIKAFLNSLNSNYE